MGLTKNLGWLSKYITADSSGQIGIGAPNPVYKLEIVQTTSGNTCVGLKNTNATGYSGVHFLSTSGVIEGHAGFYNASAGSFNNSVYFGSITAKDVVFTTIDAERMRLFSSGNLFIGTSPADAGYKLDVNGDARFSGLLNINSAIQFRYNGVFRGQIVDYNAYGGGGDYSPFFTSETSLAFGVNGNSTKALMISSGGVVLVNKTSLSAAGAGTKMQVATDMLTTGSLAGYFFENRSGGVTASSNWYGWYAVSGNIYMFNGSVNIASINTSSGVYTALSDKNKKKDFEESTLGLDAVLGLKPTLYRFKTDDAGAEKKLGFIAQEVKEFIPQAYIQTQGESEDFIGLDYNSIIPVLVKAIQELTERIKTLENK